jgi:hypothetical protein
MYVFYVLCSLLFCDIVLLCVTVFFVYFTAHCACIVLCLLVIYVLLP